MVQNDVCDANEFIPQSLANSAGRDVSFGYAAVGTERCFFLIRPVPLDHRNGGELVGIYDDVLHLSIVHGISQVQISVDSKHYRRGGKAGLRL